MASFATGDSTRVKEWLKALETSAKNEEPDKILAILDILHSEFDKNPDSRKSAVRNGAHDLILDILTSFKDDVRIVGSALKPMIRLTSFQPNPLNQEGIRCQIDLLKRKMTLPNSQLVLRWVKQCCIKSEKNRQGIFDAGVMDGVANILGDESVPGSKVRDVCSLLRALVLDDDPEFDYGNSVGRTCDIANDTLIPITILLRRFKYKRRVVSEMLRTLSVLSIRRTHWRRIQEAGGIDSILEVMRLFPDDENLNCIILRLVKILSEDDDVKVDLVTLGAAHLLVSVMSRIKTGAVSVTGLSCMAALTLRSPRNSGIFYDCGGPALIIETMKSYPESVNVQRYGTRAIANMARFNKAEARIFEASGVEAVLETAMKVHDHMEDDVKNAFTNLGLDPEPKNHWTKIR